MKIFVAIIWGGLAAGALLWPTAAARAASDELLDPIVLTAQPTPPPVLPSGCKPLHDHPTGSLAVPLHVRQTARPDVGPYTVTLPGYSSAAAAAQDSFRPILLRAAPGDSLLFDLDVADNLIVTNLHTHGLIVTPRAAAAPCLPGDYIFLRAGLPEAGGGGPRVGYRIDIPTDLPPVLFAQSADRDDLVPHPAGLYWFHAHLHGSSKPQVIDGLAGMISIGNEVAALLPPDADAATARRIAAGIKVKYLALRDVQLAVPRCVAGVPGCADSHALPDHPLPPGTQAATLSAAYDGGICGTYASPAGPPTPAPGGPATLLQGDGWCAAGGIAATDPDALWMFTVNGQLAPRITLGAGERQLWRIANLSAVVTYVLKICPGNTDCQGDSTGDASQAPLDLQVVSVDGVAATTQPGGVAGAPAGTPGYQTKRLLLMPGARAELLVANDNAGPAAVARTLRTEGISTGAVGDTWPAMLLAGLDVAPGAAAPDSAAAPPPARHFPTPVQRGPDGHRSPTPVAVPVAARPDCSFLPPASDAHAYRRQIIFDQDNTAGVFMLASQRVAQDGTLVADGRNIPLAAFPHAMLGGYNGDDFPPGPHACAVRGRGEVWELINRADELHNFHIHQGKFRLARAGDPGMAPGVPAITDPTGLLTPYNAETLPPGTANVLRAFRLPVPSLPADVWHDTLPVPPRVINGDNTVSNGRVFVYIPFEATPQIGRFVFHCHILEHEDKGMMAAFEVVDPHEPARPSRSAALDLNNPPICRAP